jgi:hypothetical protein
MGMLGGVDVERVVMSPIWGMCVVRARMSLWLVSVVTMVATFGRECEDDGRQRSQ